MRDLYYFALARKRSLMARAGRQSDDPICRKSRFRTDYAHDLSTPSNQSLASENRGDTQTTTSSCGFRDGVAPETRNLPYLQGLSSSDSCLLLEPPTSRDRFKRIEAAIGAPRSSYGVRKAHEVSRERQQADGLTRPLACSKRYDVPVPNLDKVGGESPPQLRRQPAYADLGTGELVRGRPNRKRSASIHTLLQRGRALNERTSAQADHSPAAVNASVVMPPSAEHTNSRIKHRYQPRAATITDSRDLSRDLIELLTGDNQEVHTSTTAEEPGPRSPTSRGHSQDSQSLLELLSTEPPISGSVPSYKPHIVYRLPILEFDHHDDIFRSQAALLQMMDEAKRNVERQIWQESHIPPQREQSASSAKDTQYPASDLPMPSNGNINDDGVAMTARNVPQESASGRSGASYITCPEMDAVQDVVRSEAAAREFFRHAKREPRARYQ